MASTEVATNDGGTGMVTIHERDARIQAPSDGHETAKTALRTTLERVLEHLESAHIPSCVLWRGGHVPFGLPVDSPDVDIIVPNATSPSSVIHALADLSPVQIVQRRAAITLYVPAGEYFLHAHILSRDQEWRGARYQANDEILRRARLNEGTAVASDAHQALIGWLHTLLWGGIFEDRHAQPILHAIESHGRELRGLLDNILGADLGSELWQIASSGDLATSMHLARRVRRSVFLRSLRRQFGSTVTGYLDHVLTELRLRVRPKGLTIAVLGQDGVGKTTLCDALINQPKASWPTPGIIYDHLYRPALPTPFQLRHGQFKPGKAGWIECKNPYAQPPHGPFVSVAKLVYSLVDQWLSEALWGRHHLARNHIRLLDRHRIEIRVDPARYRYGGPASVARFFSRLVPQPDIVFVLDASPDILLRRREEPATDETYRLRESYLDIARDLPNGHVLDAEGDTFRIAAEARQVILGILADRTRRYIARSRKGAPRR